MQTYTDFGQNMGRYMVGDTNELLSYIREQEGGIYITYVNPDVNAPYKLLHGMIDFSSQNDGGYGVAIGYNFYATVEHNGVHNNTYTGNYIGSDNAIHYQTVEIRYAWNAPNDGKTFIHTPSNDHKVGRQSKIFTDITGSVVYGTDSHNWDAEIHPVDENGKSLGDPLAGQLLYRAGCGTMEIARTDGSRTWISGAYSYITGGIATISNTAWYSGDGAFSINVFMNNYTLSGINANYPLPFAIKAGDSGSPAWLWNESTQRFEYVGAAQSGDFARYSQVRGAPKYTVETMEGLNVHVGLAATEGEGAHGAISEVHIGEVIYEGETYSDNVGNSATTWKGYVLDGSGNRLAEFVGMKSGVNTWGDLSGIKDNGKWFNYNSNYLLPKYVDMFFTNDLVFTAGAATTSIVADADVDLGLGYIRLCKGGQERARFDIGGDHLINSAGYIIDGGVDAYITLTNPEDYMREWRAVVETGATLHIEGTGNTNALLNLGGQGTTYLNRTGGHAAYNVLANNGTTVVIANTSQIERDFTFGFRGGVLDMNGNSLVWNNDNNASAAGFTIHALDEQAIIANRAAGTTTTLTWTQGGARTWLGSFQDTADSSLKFVYNGGADGVLTMHSIHTDLQNAGSGIEVQSGRLVLSGVNTVHGKGSIDGRSANRYLNPMDWHYADAKTSVTVQTGGTFELGSHARLAGDVTVRDGGTFIMRENVQHRMEYIEGGSMLEDTEAIRAFFGLKGDISLTNGALRIEFNEGVTAVNEYAGNISGTGTLTVNAGLSGGVQKLSGTNSMTGTRSVTGGGLVLANAGAFNTNDNATGDNAWLIASPGWLAVEGMEQTTANLLSHIHADSDGTLAFSQNAAAALDMRGHADLFLGAQAGKSVEYGVPGTAQRLTAWHTTDAGRTQWLFGGGGGEIVVNWRLSGDSDLVLGNPHMTGTVTLTNTGNNFTGNIIFTQGSNVVLNFTDLRALGGASVDLSYGKAMSGGSDIAAMLRGSVITSSASGILMVDDSLNADINLSGHTALQLGSNAAGLTYTGNITVARNAAYRFGGPGELILQNGLAANGTNDLIVDGQGFSGGLVALNGVSSITGTVTVMGHDADIEASTGITSGDITLALVADDALAGASTLRVKEGGTVIVGAGSSQHVNALDIRRDGVVQMGLATTLYAGTLNVAAGAGIVSASQNLAALQVGGGVINGAVNVGTLVKTGSGDLSLAQGHNLTVGTLDVREGSVTLNADPSITGEILLHNASTLDFNGKKLTTSLDVAAGETAVIHNGSITFRGANGHLASGGTLDLTGVTTVNLELPSKDSGQVYGGTLKLGNTTLKNCGTVDNMSYEFDRLHVDNANAVLAQSGWNTSWNIHSLTGSGSFTWQSNSTHSIPNVLTLDGEGDFSGTIFFNRNHSGGGDGRRFQAFTVIAHERAVQNAVVKMNGTDNANYAALVLSADEVHMKGLVSDWGKGYNYIYAGSALETPQPEAPVSSRNATLVIDTEADTYHTFYGGVGGDAEHAISIVKTGAGYQFIQSGAGTYGVSATFHDVTVLGGGLYFSYNPLLVPGSSLTITGDYTIGQGATLSTGGNITLGAGQVLSTVAVDGQTGSANVTAVQLAGGSLAFSGKGLESLAGDAFLLNISGVSKTADTLTVDFTDSSYLHTGKTYRLASGDFGSLGLTYTATGVEGLTATFTADAQGLYVTWQAANGALIWDGTDAAHSWLSSTYGTQTYAADKVTCFYLTDAAENKHVQVATPYTAMMGTQRMEISGTDYVFDGGILAFVSGSITLADGASATFNNNTQANGELGLRLGKGASATFNSITYFNGGITLDEGATARITQLSIPLNLVTMAEGSRLVVQENGTASFPLDGASTGTLEVESGAAANIGTVSGTAKYGFAGSGKITLAVGSSAYLFTSTGNEFNGTLDINLGTAAHFVIGGDSSSALTFADGYRPDIVLRGGSGNARFILNSAYYGRDKVLEIGSLSSADANVSFLGNWNHNPSGQLYRYISVHQDTDTTFRGEFANGDNRSIGLIMNGAGEVGGGTLTLTGNSMSAATLIVNTGTVAIGGDNGHWNGDVEVYGGGQLHLQRDNALNAGKVLYMVGNGVAEFTDAAGAVHAARRGALRLDDGVTLASGVNVSLPGASVMAEDGVTATISGAVTGYGNLTKIGGGTLRLTGTSTSAGDLYVEEGALTLVNGSVWGDDIIVENGGTLALEGTGTFTVQGDVVRNYSAGTHSGDISAFATDTASTINLGGTTLNLTGGDFSAVSKIVGGVRLAAASNGKGARISGVSQVNLDGADLGGATIYGGSDLNQYQCAMGISSGKTEVNLRSGAVDTVYGGHLMDSAGQGALQDVSLGSARVKLDGATVSGNIYGGSRVIRNSADSTVTQGDVTVDLTSGSLAGDVYAGGKQGGSTKLQTASTEVKIGNAMRFTGSGQTISGGYEVAEGMDGSTITGSRTLTLSSEGDYTNLGGLAFTGFDTIDSAATSAVISNFTGTGMLTKKGAGVVTLSQPHTLTTTTVEAGTLAFSNGADFTGAVTVADGATLSLAGGISLATAITSAGTVDLTGASFSLTAADFTNGRYDIVAGTGVTTGTLTVADFTVEGASRVRLLGMGGSSVYLVLGEAQSLVWNGTDGGNTWGGANWLNGSDQASFASGDNVTFGNAANKNVLVTAGGEETANVTITGTDYTFSQGALAVSGNLAVEAGASATFQNKLTVEGDVVIKNGGTMELHQDAAIRLAADNTNTGTLSVTNWATVDLGDVSGTAKYKLDGDGTFRMNVTDGNYILASADNTFTGNLEVNLGGGHFIIGSGTEGTATFASKTLPDLVLTGGSSGSTLIVNSNYHGEEHALHIGSLESHSESVILSGKNGGNPNGDDFRYIAVHQATNTTFAGKFENSGAKDDRAPALRDIGLIMDGTGTLTLTANNLSAAKLIVKNGAVSLAGASGHWNGEVDVKAGGQLHLQRNGALNNAKELTLAGNGTGTRIGALVLDGGIDLDQAVGIDNAGASILVGAGDTASISQAVSGGKLTKVGGGTLSLSGAVTTNGLAVEAGTLSLGGAVTLDGAIENAGTVDFNGATLTLTGVEGVKKYGIVSGTGAITGSLTTADISFTGAVPTGDLRLFGMGGGNVFVYAGAGELVWNGTQAEGGNTWAGDNWMLEGASTGFLAGDTARFTADAANKTVIVAAGGANAGAIEVSATGYSFTGGAITAGGVTLAEGTTTTINNDGLSATGLTVQGEGASLTIAAGKTVTLTGAATGGTLAVGGSGSLAVNGGGCLQTDVTVGSAAHLNLAGADPLASSATITLAGTLGLGDGVALNGRLALTGGNVWVNENATATINGAISGNLTKTGQGVLSITGTPPSGTWNINAGTVKVAQSGNITLATASTGKLEVAEDATINLGSSLPGNFKLAGNGVVKMNPTSWYTWTSTGSTFSGTLEITLGAHFQLQGAGTAGSGVFAKDARPDLVLKGGGNSAGLILGQAYAGTDNALNIGSLTGEAASQIRGDMDSAGHRYIAVHQDDNTTFAGTFINSTDRSVGLIKNGTGTLTLTGANASTAALIINKGTVVIGGSNGKWVGDITVKAGTQLDLQKTNALGGTLTLNGTGVEGREGGEGALKLANGVTVNSNIIIGDSGASVMTGNEVTATLGGTLSGTGTLTKLGSGTLKASSTALAGAPVDVTAGKVVVTDTLGDTAALGGVKLADGTTLAVKLSTGDSGTQLTLNAASAGTVEVASGMLRVNAANASNIGSASLKMAGGSGLVFAESANSTRSEFANDIDIASGILTLRAWGNSNLSADNIISGKITGAGTLSKTDGGKVTITGDMSGFSGTLAVAADAHSSGNNKLFIDADATVSALAFESQGALLVGTDHKLTVTGATKDNLASYFAHIVSDATHTGTVSLGIDKVDNQKLSGTHNVNANFEFTAATGLELNNWNASSAYNSLVNVNEGGSITVKTGTLAITSFQEMAIKGGTVTAPIVQIGYNQGGNYRGHLTLESGTLVTKNIVMYGQSNDQTHVSKFTMTGGTLDLRGGTGDALSITGSAYEVGISGGEILVDAMRTLGGAITLGGVEIRSTGEGSGLTFAAGGGVMWTNTITNNGGVLNFNGAFTLGNVTAALLESTKAGYVDVLDADSGNGFADNRLWLVRNTNGGTVSLAADGSTTTLNGTTYTLCTDAGLGVYLLAQGAAAEEGLYYVNNEEGMVYGAGDNSAASNRTTGIVVRGGKITLARSLATTVTQGISLENDATIYINTGVTLSTAEVHRDGGALTIDGSGVYVNGTGKTLTATMADTWAGTIQVNGDFNFINVDSFGKTANNSTVRFAGVTGWFEPSKPDSVLNIDLLNPDGATPALKLVGTSGKTYNFAGKVSGTGDMEVKAGSTETVASDTDTFNFNGDVEDWTGKMSVTTSSGHNMKVTFAGGKLNMDIERNGDAGTLTVELSGDKTMTGSFSGADVSVQNQLTLEEGASISTGAGVTVCATGEQGTLKSATLSGTSLRGWDADHCGELDGVAFVFENVAVEMRDMVISADTVIGKPMAFYGLMDAGADTPAATVLDVTNTTLVVEKSALASTVTLTADQVVNNALTMESGSTLATLVCMNFSLDELTGALALDLSAFSASDLMVDYLAVQFSGVSALAEGFNVSADVPGFGAATSVTTEGATAYFKLQATKPDQVPEPATATLSLLALAALAARRRRK